MKKNFRQLFTVILALTTIFSIVPFASADGAYHKGDYRANQYYVYDESETEVYTVEFSAGKVYQGACKNRDTMISCGYDAFIVKNDDYYYIMSGKFRSYSDAEYYLDEIKTVKGADDGYIAKTYLPEYAIEEFENEYYYTPYQSYCPQNSNPLMGGPSYKSKIPWEASIPLYFDLYDEGENFQLLYDACSDMAVRIEWEPVAATSAKSYERILSEEYNVELGSHGSTSNGKLNKKSFYVTGFEGEYLYYVKGMIGSAMYYELRFSFPKADSNTCLPILYQIRDSFQQVD